MNFEGNTRDNQEVFDYLWQRFVVDEVPMCVVEGRGCLYAPQEQDQIGCAVGCLLPPDVAKEWDTRGSSLYSGVDPSLTEVYFDKTQKGFLLSLQNMHDFRQVKDREGRMREVASDFNLTVPTTTGEPA